MAQKFYIVTLDEFLPLHKEMAPNLRGRPREFVLGAESLTNAMGMLPPAVQDDRIVGIRKAGPSLGAALALLADPYSRT